MSRRTAMSNHSNSCSSSSSNTNTRTPQRHYSTDNNYLPTGSATAATEDHTELIHDDLLDEDEEDIETLMMRKACELFAVCDVESKGFITRRDMQRLQEQLALTHEQLDDVFTSLDVDANGYLTLQEFTDGFGSFLGVTSSGSPDSHMSPESSAVALEVYENERTQHKSRDTSRHHRHHAAAAAVTSRGHDDYDDVTNDDEHFQAFIGHLGATDVLDDVEGIRLLWLRLRHHQPELLPNLEDFLQRITTELRRTHTDYRSLETALKSKSVAHDEEVRKLYEEMELQIQAEKERILAEERAREKLLKDEMEKELQEKDKQLQELVAHHTKMKQKLDELNSQETETKQENEKLQKDKEELEDMLDDSQRHLDESRAYINQLRQQQKEEKRERALAALHVTEGIALERESLVRQLDLLRDMNRKLRDDRDEAELRRLVAGNLQQELNELAPCLERSNSMASSMSRLSRGESVATDVDTLDSTTVAAATSYSSTASSLAELRQQQIVRDLAARRQQLTKRGSIMSNYVGGSTTWRQEEPDLDSDIEMDNEDVEFDDLPDCVDRHLNGELNGAVGFKLGQPPRRRGVASCDCNDASGNDVRSRSTRQQPVGANSSAECDEMTSRDTDLESVPVRVFKIVFVGDSGVGKSSFIHQFCSNGFRQNFQATIGVDFQVKNIRVDGHLIALQLWDTAGQERFRSITKQYFRKADGVLVMYDVTSEATFRSVRNWMTSVREGTEEETVILMIGNKMDLVTDDTPQTVTDKDGTRLADEFGALFYETSAKSSLNVYESMEAMARLLREREDREMEKALQLSEIAVRKRGCCK